MLIMEESLDKTKKCDFCGGKELVAVYQVPDSLSGIEVLVCNICGLVQSLRTVEVQTRDRVVSTSSGSDWGNIRHGKGLRFNQVKEILNSNIPWNRINAVLDVGSNRGDFVLWLSENKKVDEIIGIEPDYLVVDEYRDLENLNLVLDRFENVSLPSNHFDLVYCVHTLEHSDSASLMLKRMFDCLRIGGFLFLEVPNINIIKEEDTVEEFFIDKHTFHFNRSLLCQYLKFLGFKILYGENSSDQFNITFVAVKEEGKQGNQIFRSETNLLAENNKKLLRNYSDTLYRNREKLAQLTDTKIIPLLSRQKIVFWGAGRIFDALVKYSHLGTEGFELVDEYLWKIVPKIHGIEVHRPEYLRISQPQVVIVLARSSADEIVSKARSFGCRNVIKFEDLLLSSV